MKYLVYILSLSLFFCSLDIESQTTAKFDKYPTVIQMLKESNDFSETDGSLKILSKEKEGKPLHIQVSKSIFDGDLEKIIKEQTMRDIVYVAFQSFAQTDINTLTISSVPMKGGVYIDKYKLTIIVSRDKAKRILKKYLNTENFQTLYRLESTIWVPNANFDFLKFKKLNEVFADLKNN